MRRVFAGKQQTSQHLQQCDVEGHRAEIDQTEDLEQKLAGPDLTNLPPSPRKQTKSSNLKSQPQNTRPMSPRKNSRPDISNNDAGLSVCSRCTLGFLVLLTLALLVIRQLRIDEMHKDIEAGLECFPLCAKEEVFRHAREQTGSYEDVGPENSAETALVKDAQIESTSASATVTSGYDEDADEIGRNIDNYNFLPELEISPEEELAARKRVLAEFGISETNSFGSVQEIHDHIGYRCPALRHCGDKIAQGQIHFGSGQFIDKVFHPHSCWLYNIRGSEYWLQSSKATEEIQQFAIFLDFKSKNSPPALYLEVAASKNSRFEYFYMKPPATYAAEKALQATLRELIESKLGVNLNSVALSVMVNWPEVGDTSLGAARRILRIVNLLPLHSAEVYWLLRSFSADPTEIIQIIEDTREATKAVKTVQQYADSSVLVRRGQVSMTQLQSLAIPQRLTLDQIRATQTDLSNSNLPPSSYLFVDARSRRVDYAGIEPSSADHLVQLASVHLSKDAAMQGFSLNVNRDLHLVVFDAQGTGADAQAVAQTLLYHGLVNVWILDTQDVTKISDAMKFLRQEDRLAEIYNHTAPLRSLDLFALTLTMPRAVADPSVWAGTGDVVANLVLNVMYRRQIMDAASAQSDQHICASEQDCTTCTPLVGRFPASRLSFELITKYLHAFSVPAIIELSPTENIFDGTWETLYRDQRQLDVKVRRDYSRAKTRSEEFIRLGEFLTQSGIVNAEGKQIPANKTDIKLSEESPPLYVGNNKLTPDLMRAYQFKYPKWVTRSLLQRPSMWMGPYGSFSGLHVDHSNLGNMAFQALGQKKWYFFPPKATPFMYGRRRGIVIWSLVNDPSKYGFGRREKFPEFKYALCEGLEVTVNEHELLYNPPEWWHAVQNIDSSLMINFWIKPEAQMPPNLQGLATSSSTATQQKRPVAKKAAPPRGKKTNIAMKNKRSLGKT